MSRTEAKDRQQHAQEYVEEGSFSER